MSRPFPQAAYLSKPGERIMAIASAGNLAISQSVLSTLTEGLEDPHTGELETLLNAPTIPGSPNASHGENY